MGNLTSKMGLGSIYQTTPLNCLDPTLAWEQLKHSTPVIELKVDSPEEPLGTIHLLCKQTEWVGGLCQLLTFAYKVGGWVIDNAYVSK